MSRYVLEVVIIVSFVGIFDKTMGGHCPLTLDFSPRGIVRLHMASAGNYRVYEMTVGNQVAGSHTIVCDSDQKAIEKAKKMLDDRDLEIRHGARFVARLRVADNK